MRYYFVLVIERFKGGIKSRGRKAKSEKANQKRRKENKRAEKASNEIDSILDEAKESIINYIKMQFHEDISDFISTFSKQQILDLQDHLYDFEDFEELKKGKKTSITKY